MEDNLSQRNHSYHSPHGQGMNFFNLCSPFSLFQMLLFPRMIYTISFPTSSLFIFIHFDADYSPNRLDTHSDPDPHEYHIQNTNNSRARITAILTLIISLMFAILCITPFLSKVIKLHTQAPEPEHSNPAPQSPRSPPSPLDVEPDVLPAGRNARSADARFAIVIDWRMM